MPVRLWRCVCVREGLDMYARNAGWRIIELYNNLGWNTFNAHQVQPHCMGRCVLAMIPAMRLRELSESSSGQMSGQGLVSQYWTECPPFPCCTSPATSCIILRRGRSNGNPCSSGFRGSIKLESLCK